MPEYIHEFSLAEIIVYVSGSITFLVLIGWMFEEEIKAKTEKFFHKSKEVKNEK